MTQKHFRLFGELVATLKKNSDENSKINVNWVENGLLRIFKENNRRFDVAKWRELQAKLGVY